VKPEKAIARLHRAYPKALHLLQPKWRAENAKSGISSAGFCYIATEAAFHLVGGQKSAWRPKVAKYADGTHWWLEMQDGARLDPTADQYEDEQPPYELGRWCGFLRGYENPSRRANELICIAKGLRL